MNDDQLEDSQTLISEENIAMLKFYQLKPFSSNILVHLTSFGSEQKVPFSFFLLPPFARFSYLFLPEDEGTHLAGTDIHCSPPAFDWTQRQSCAIGATYEEHTMLHLRDTFNIKKSEEYRLRQSHNSTGTWHLLCKICNCASSVHIQHTNYEERTSQPLTDWTNRSRHITLLGGELEFRPSIGHDEFFSFPSSTGFITFRNTPINL